MYKGYGVIKFSGRLKIEVDNNICFYYRRLIFYHNKSLKTATPAHGAHISLYIPSIHGAAPFSRIRNLIDEKVEFSYDPRDIRKGGHNKGFVNYYLPVYSPRFAEIEEYLGFTQQKNFFGYHLTLCNNKNL